MTFVMLLVVGILPIDREVVRRRQAARHGQQIVPADVDQLVGIAGGEGLDQRVIRAHQ